MKEVKIKKGKADCSFFQLDFLSSIQDRSRICMEINMIKNVIEINGLSKYYGKFKGIEDVSFTVEEGEIFGFIGPNGAGKSTTLRTLLALIRPTKGSATIFGKDCIKEAHIIAKDIGYLPSESNYYENMKVSQLLRYTQDLYQKDCSKKIKELCSRLNLDITRKICDLSFGNKKKVGIICALLHSPKLIILDEPTSGLDPLIQQSFFDILKEENKEGTTILFSSHVLSEVQRICQKVAILKDGQIIRIQNINELKETGYKKIELTVTTPIPDEYFDGMNIADYKQRDNIVSFIFRGNVSQIIEKINDLNVADVLIQEPSLEEIFLHYYE